MIPPSWALAWRLTNSRSALLKRASGTVVVRPFVLQESVPCRRASAASGLGRRTCRCCRPSDASCGWPVRPAEKDRAAVAEQVVVLIGLLLFGRRVASSAGVSSAGGANKSSSVGCLAGSAAGVAAGSVAGSVTGSAGGSAAGVEGAVPVAGSLAGSLKKSSASLGVAGSSTGSGFSSVEGVLNKSSCVAAGGVVGSTAGVCVGCRVRRFGKWCRRFGCRLDRWHRVHFGLGRAGQR